MKNAARFVFLALSVAVFSSFAVADTPGAHPAYLHALSDLRNARAFLYYSPARFNSDQQRAIDEIDAAIHAVTEAAIDDGKPMNYRPPADGGWSRTDRLTHAIQLLDMAKDDVDKRESNGWSRQLKSSALHHIKEARKCVRSEMKHEQQE